MLQIDIDADLNMVDDEDRNFARLPLSANHLRVGGVAAAGRPGAWSWVVIDEIDTQHGLVFFHQVDSAEARVHGQLVLAAS